METTKDGPEATMKTLISQGMSEVAYQALVNSETRIGDSESKDYKIEYDFMCLQNNNATGMIQQICHNLLCIMDIAKSFGHFLFFSDSKCGAADCR